MTRIINWHNYASSSNATGEVFTKPSLTVPSMTLPLEELVKRYARGQNVIVHEGIYLGPDSDIPDNLERMDFAEAKEAATAIAAYIEETRTGLQKRAAARESEKTPAPPPNPAPPDTDKVPDPVPPK